VHLKWWHLWYHRKSDWGNTSALRKVWLVKCMNEKWKTPTVCRTCSAALKQSTALSYSLLRLKSTPNPHWTSGSIVAEGCLRAAAIYSSWTSLWMSLINTRNNGICWVVYVLPLSIVASLLALDDRNIFTICQWLFSFLGKSTTYSY
jgi:hypothetical protein